MFNALWNTSSIDRDRNDKEFYLGAEFRDMALRSLRTLAVLTTSQMDGMQVAYAVLRTSQIDGMQVVYAAAEVQLEVI